MTTNWPSREQWAKERRTPYYDRFPDTSDSLAEYATPEEIAALKAALGERWNHLGTKIRELGGRDASDVTRNLQSDRSSIKWALKIIDEGGLPCQLETFSGAKDIFAPFHERYGASEIELRERTLREIEQTPIDDNAWNAELKRRARVEAWETQVLAQ
jgi:hypothetical protein